MANGELTPKPDWEATRNMHKALLDALRHREQDIVRFVVILVSALGGFVWLFQVPLPYRSAALVAGTYGVLLALLTGALYALALGYNYRHLTLQLAKLELRLRLTNADDEGVILRQWPQQPEDLERRSRWGVIPWSTPPGIIKVFWTAFLAAILLVTTVGYVGSGRAEDAPGQTGTGVSDSSDSRLRPQRQGESVNPLLERLRCGIPWVGGACFLLGLLGPVHNGRKIIKVCREEGRWKTRTPRKPKPKTNQI